jgi:hypothetical protein
MTTGPSKLSVGGLVLLMAVATACSNTSTTVSPSASPSSRHTRATSPSASAPVPTPTKSSNAPQANPPATEFNPPGDIPDNAVFTDYRKAGSTVHIKVPEGWARSTSGGTATFTDHFNSIAIETTRASSRPTVASARRTEVPALRRSVAKFAGGAVTRISRQHGPAILVTYLLDSKPDAVTGKVVRDAAQRHEFWQHGQEAILTLTGPKNADNVDPWRLVSDSLRWQ